MFVAKDESRRPKMHNNVPINETLLIGIVSHKALLNGLTKNVAPNASEPSHARKEKIIKISRRNSLLNEGGIRGYENRQNRTKI